MPANRSAERDRLFAQLEPVVLATGHELEDVSVLAAGRRSLVRVIVDADGGVSLDAIAEVSRAVSEALDQHDPFAGPFTLEVSSPGVDRPLTEPRHWRRAVGRLVSTNVDGAPLTGRVGATTGAGVVLDIDGTQRELDWSRLGPGKVQVEFNRSDEPAEEQA